ncbi:MAG TPA: esterase, partial [Bryobacteraceae bacterium]|nr:esterase [Bryobacteraceae bacterium]
QIRLFWISCGSDDGLLGVNKQFMDYMQSRGVTFTFKEYPNMAHVWPVWRDSLATLAPLLFQPKAK